MRIRKHFPPSSSSFSSLPLSDPQLIRRSSLVVVVQPQYPAPHVNNLHEEAKTSKSNPDHRLSSDPDHQPPIIHHQTTTSQQTLLIPPEIPPLVCTQQQVEAEVEHKEIIIKDERWKTEEEEELKISNDIRNESTLSTEVGDVQFPPQSASSSCCQALNKWGEGDRIVPPKKRKGSFARSIGNSTSKGMIMIKPKMKSKTNKKCLQQNGDDNHDMADHRKKLATDHYYNKLEGGTGTSTSSSTKKSKRGSVIMEGSRCSRVNGRGWRCCQQTLVGYSLCEHHLGKGRLRSMTSVRNRASAAAVMAVAQQQEVTKSSSTISTYNEDTDHNNNNNDDDDDINIVADHPEEDGRESPLIRMSKKKRKIIKIGSVKARSISSLLGQTDNSGAANGLREY